MQINQLGAKNLPKTRKRVGRGGKRGTYSGHGGKGQTARAGHNLRPIVRDTLKRYPKLRGYKNRPSQFKAATINLEKISIMFGVGEIVNPKALVEKNLIARVSGKYPQVKILGGGSIDKDLVIEGCTVSQVAKEKIQKAGGTIR